MDQIPIDAVADLEAQHVQLDAAGKPRLLGSPRVVVLVVRTSAGVKSFQGPDWSHALRYLLSIEGTCWWHSGGRYDLRWLLSQCLAVGIVPELQLGRSGGLGELRVGSSRHRDSMGLWGVSLAELAEGLPHQKQALGLGCICGRDCGGYCRIRTDGPRAERRVVADHCVSDVDALWDGIHRIREWQADLDFVPKYTLAGCAWNTCQRDVGESKFPEIDKSRSRLDDIRECLYPGRSQTLMSAAGHHLDLDQSSAYARQYSEPLPWGQAAHLYGRMSTKLYLQGRAGVYSCVVRVPDCHLPPLPYRVPHGRVSYPVGVLKGRWALPELQYAETCGVQVLQVLESHTWARPRPLLHDWAHQRFAQRLGDPIRSRYVKHFLASLYGALAQRPVVSQLLIDPPRPRPCPCTAAGRRRAARARGDEEVGTCRSSSCPCQGRCCEGCQGDCGAYIRWSPEEVGWNIWLAQVWRPQPRCHLGAAVYTAAGCRISLHKKAVEVDGGQDVVGMDTDGLQCLKPRSLDPSGVLGGWRLKGTYDSAKASHPRVREAVDSYTGEVREWRSGHARSDPAGRGHRHLAREGLARVSRSWRLVSLKEGLRSGQADGPWQQKEVVRRVLTHKDRWGQLRMGDRVQTDSGGWRAPMVGECE